MDSSCQAMNEICVKGVREVIAGPNTELQARNPVIVLGFLVGLVSILFPAIHLLLPLSPYLRIFMSHQLKLVKHLMQQLPR